LTSKERKQCHQLIRTGPNGSAVSDRFPSREYNAHERPWCIQQALATPGKAVVTGPYLDAAWGQDIQLWIRTIGHGIFDLVSNKFIGCTLVDVLVDSLKETLTLFQLGETSSVALVRWGDDQDIPEGTNRAGTVIACGGQCQDDADTDDPYHINELSRYFGIDAVLFQEMRTLVDYANAWDTAELARRYKDTLFIKNGRITMKHPVLYVSSEYHHGYRPTFMVIMSIMEDGIYGESDKMVEVVGTDIVQAIIQVSLVGIGGL
jgi:hypothetical protein